MATFSKRFKLLRTERKLTQDALAELFFLNKSSISRYESGKQVPEPQALQKFADFFNVSLDYLMGISDIRNSNELEFPKTERYQSNLDMDITNEIKSLMNKLNYAIHFGNIKPIILDNEELPIHSAELLRLAIDVGLHQIKDMKSKLHNIEIEYKKINLNNCLKSLNNISGMTKQDWENLLGLDNYSPSSSIYLSNSDMLLQYIGTSEDVEDLYLYALDSLNIKNALMLKASSDVQLNFLMAVLEDIHIDKTTDHCQLTFKHELGLSSL